MKKLFALMIALGVSFAAFAGDSGWYGGVTATMGANNSTLAIAPEEAFALADANNHATRTQQGQLLTKGLLLGYNFNQRIALEVAVSEPAAVVATNTSGYFMVGDQNGVYRVPFSMTQKKEVTATQAVLILKRPMNPYVSVFGGVGVEQNEVTKWKRIEYSYPASWGQEGSYRGWTSSSSETNPVVKFGVLLGNPMTGFNWRLGLEATSRKDEEQTILRAVVAGIFHF